MPPAQKDALRTAIASEFASLVSLGGKQIDPAIYGQANLSGKPVYPERDRSEMALLARYLDLKRGVFFGICRGHQLLSLLHGFQMSQNLQKDLHPQHRHMNAKHRIYLRPEADSVLSRFLEGSKARFVNSTHKKAVLPTYPSALRVVATDQKDLQGIVEATESLDGLALGFQFHPEKLFSPAGAAIRQGMVNYAVEANALRKVEGCAARLRELSPLFRKPPPRVQP